MNSPLRHARLTRGLTLRQVAEEIGTDPASVSRIERGRQFPRRPLLEALSQALKVDPGQIILPGPERKPCQDPDR